MIRLEKKLLLRRDANIGEQMLNMERSDRRKRGRAQRRFVKTQHNQPPMGLNVCFDVYFISLVPFHFLYANCLLCIVCVLYSFCNKSILLLFLFLCLGFNEKYCCMYFSILDYNFIIQLLLLLYNLI